MKSIGFRCWKDKFSYVIVEGIQNNPVLISNAFLQLPKNFSRPEQLNWFRKEIIEILDTNEIDIAIFKSTEPISVSKDPQRGELEGILQEAVYSHHKTISIEGLIKVQLNSRTNARKAKYLGELMRHDAFENLAKTTYEDACISALSGLPK